MDKLSRIEKVVEFRKMNFRELPILDFLRDKLSRKRAKFAKLAKVYLAKVNPVKVASFSVSRLHLYIIYRSPKVWKN